MKYRAVLFNLIEGFTKDVYWDGPDHVSLVNSLETELACGGDFIEVEGLDIRVGGVSLFMLYTLVCDPPNQLLAWRIHDGERWSSAYLGNALFFPPDSWGDYTGWVEGDCPMNCAQIAAHIMLVKYSEDFAEAQVVGTPAAFDDQRT
jgi:hypothetical protein